LGCVASSKYPYFQMTQAQMGRVREHIYRLATLLCWQNRLK
jgi:hypothetical protein